MTREEHDWLAALHAALPKILDLHAEMSARKAGRSDEQLATDELRVAQTLTKPDIPEVAEEIAGNLNDRRDRY